MAIVMNVRRTMLKRETYPTAVELFQKTHSSCSVGKTARETRKTREKFSWFDMLMFRNTKEI